MSARIPKLQAEIDRLRASMELALESLDCFEPSVGDATDRLRAGLWPEEHAAASTTGRLVFQIGNADDWGTYSKRWGLADNPNAQRPEWHALLMSKSDEKLAEIGLRKAKP
jgi:hypothetical protein